MRPSSPVRAVAAALVVTISIALGLTACSSSSDSGEDPPAIAVTVHIADGVFDPREVVIEPGGTVMWINDDVTTHSITFLDRDLRSGAIRPRKSWIHTFDTTGEYLYFDDIRNTMKGSVVVRLTP